MNTSSIHYGEKIISILKNRGEYGEYFTYEEYQKLKKAATAEEFTAFIRATKWRGVVVYKIPGGTIQDLRLIRPEVMVRGAAAKNAGNMAVELIYPIGCLIAPFFFFFVLCFPGTSRRIVRRCNRRAREQLRQRYEVHSLPEGAIPEVPPVPPPS